MTNEKEQKEDKYHILITGKNIHFEIPVNNLSDFNDLQNLLELLKKKLPE